VNVHADESRVKLIKPALMADKTQVFVLSERVPYRANNRLKENQIAGIYLPFLFRLEWIPMKGDFRCQVVMPVWTRKASVLQRPVELVEISCTFLSLCIINFSLILSYAGGVLFSLFAHFDKIARHMFHFKHCRNGLQLPLRAFRPQTQLFF